MSSLILDSGYGIFDEEEIRKEVGEFYQKLYASRESSIGNVDLDCFDNLQQIPNLSVEELQSLQGPLTYSEVSRALQNMKNNKSSGSDGFTVEFFKFFLRDIGHSLLNSINYGCDHNITSITQREGIITCIPKGNK